MVVTTCIVLVVNTVRDRSSKRCYLASEMWESGTLALQGMVDNVSFIQSLWFHLCVNESWSPLPFPEAEFIPGPAACKWQSQESNFVLSSILCCFHYHFTMKAFQSGEMAEDRTAIWDRVKWEDRGGRIEFCLHHLRWYQADLLSPQGLYSRLENCSRIKTILWTCEIRMHKGFMNCSCPTAERRGQVFLCTTEEQ